MKQAEYTVCSMPTTEYFLLNYIEITSSAVKKRGKNGARVGIEHPSSLSKER
ncbi:hypothetical protein [Holospora curviuscula]|uniref:Uncharacterized protein n=1 Tax=Holospora curviuscula TaxID=1082868 RepID=A0A2S5R816_9PROT|nr:hypothetical protein [Holospora curviuscula]PPE03476.1 hypothetical protein HCUR_01014 [Holospora curviuscula]